MPFLDVSTTLNGQNPPTDSAHHFTCIHLPGLAEAPSEPTQEGAFERHWLRTLAHVLVEEIHDLYFVEQMLDENLVRMSLASTEPILRFLSQIHAKLTCEHLRRLEQIHQMIGQSPNPHDCLDVEGLQIGLREIMVENHPGRSRDLAMLAVILKIKRREVAGYCNTRDYAQLLGLNPVAALLQQTLDEEASLLERLTKLERLLAPQAQGRFVN
jgi:ferritin-like metal-binding protein YciE